MGWFIAPTSFLMQLVPQGGKYWDSTSIKGAASERWRRLPGLSQMVMGSRHTAPRPCPAGAAHDSSVRPLAVSCPGAVSLPVKRAREGSPGGAHRTCRTPRPSATQWPGMQRGRSALSACQTRSVHGTQNSPGVTCLKPHPCDEAAICLRRRRRQDFDQKTNRPAGRSGFCGDFDF